MTLGIGPSVRGLNSTYLSSLSSTKYLAILRLSESFNKNGSLIKISFNSSKRITY